MRKVSLVEGEDVAGADIAPTLTSEKQLIELFGPDMAVVKQYLCSGHGGSDIAAGAIADKVLRILGSYGPQAAGALNNILLDIVASVSVELPWLDKFIDWRSLFQNQAVDGSDPEEMRQRFLSAVHFIKNAIVPFVRMDTCGQLSKETQVYVLTHIDEAITVNSLAAAMHFNTHHLSKTFKKQTGINLGDYITEMKMARARLLIGRGRPKAAVVAGLLGFRDVRYFSRLFRERIGQTPTEYRRSLVWFQPG